MYPLLLRNSGSVSVLDNWNCCLCRKSSAVAPIHIEHWVGKFVGIYGILTNFNIGWMPLYLVKLYQNHSIKPTLDQKHFRTTFTAGKNNGKLVDSAKIKIALQKIAEEKQLCKILRT